MFDIAGVLELRGGTAGVKEYKTSLLASHGFVCLTLSYIASNNVAVLPPFLELD